MATADKLITVAENVPKVYHAGQLNVIENTSTLKKSVSGSVFLINDVSPVTHDMSVKVRGKNLIPYPYTITTLTINGLTFTANDDGTITVNAEAEKALADTVVGFTLLHLYPKGTYIMSGCPTGGSTSTYFLNAVNANGADYTLYKNDTGIGIPIVLDKDDTLKFSIRIKKDTVVENLIFKPQLELDTMTAYTPYVPDLTAVKVKKCGKNLFDNNKLSDWGLTLSDGKYTGSVSVLNNKTLFSSFMSNTQYTISVKASNASKSSFTLLININYTDGTIQTVIRVNSTTEKVYSFTSTANKSIGNISSTYYTGDTINIAYIQIEEGTISTEYEPYEGAEYTPTADGTVNGVTSLYPNTTLTTNMGGVLIDCEYYRDIDADEVITRTVTSYSNPKIKVVGKYAFFGCMSLTTADFPVATSIGDSAFYNCSALIIVDFPAVTSIGASAFYNCSSLSTINFPVVTSIESYAFYNCSALIIVDFPVATSIGDSAFYNCSALIIVDFPAVTSIGASAFYNCSALIIVDFPAVTSIGASAFNKCSSLTTADFLSVTNIRNQAFYNCKSLTTLILRNNTICTLSNTNAFTGCTKITGTGGYIYVPSSLVNAYKTATNWVTYASKFRALEDYTVDGTTTGALDESKVSA